MQKRFIPALFLVVYGALLIKVMVFKDVPLMRVGGIMLNFGGTAEGQANLVPFKTIVPYFFGEQGLIIAGINLAGNIALLVPIGFLIPFVYRNMQWKKSLALGVAAGLTIEGAQVLFRVGIFDIDDVILNALGVMIGHFTCTILGKWVREKRYINILIAVIIVIAATAGAFYALYPKDQPVNPRGVVGNSQAGAILQNGDLCGGTGGNGEIASVGISNFIIKRNDNDSGQIIHLTGRARIETSTGSATLSDLKIGDHVTLVGGPNPDGSFTAEAVFLCNPTY